MSHVALSMDAIATAATQLLSWDLACTKPELNQLPASGDQRHSQLHELRPGRAEPVPTALCPRQSESKQCANLRLLPG